MPHIKPNVLCRISIQTFFFCFIPAHYLKLYYGIYYDAFLLYFVKQKYSYGGLVTKPLKKISEKEAIVCIWCLQGCQVKAIRCQRCSPEGNWWLCLHPRCSHAGLQCTHLGFSQRLQSAENKKHKQDRLWLKYNLTGCDKKKKVILICKATILLYHTLRKKEFIVIDQHRKKPLSFTTYLFDLVFKVGIVFVIDHLG